MAELRKPVSAPGFWEGLYAERQDGWELGEPAPSLQAWLASGGTGLRGGVTTRGSSRATASP